MDIETIGLDREQRSDFELRTIFVEAFNIVTDHMDEQGNWSSSLGEVLAHDSLHARFPDIDGERLFATLASIAAVRASGRMPSN